MSNKLRPAIAGGLLIGLLAIIPFVNLVCCLWVLLGGGLAAYLYIKKSPAPVLMAEGVQLGASAGAIGGLIYVLLGVPVNILMGNPLAGLMLNFVRKIEPSQAEMVRQRMEQQQSRPFIEQYLSTLPRALFGFVLIVVFATLSGLLTVALFEKRKTGQEGPPPPPPPFPPPATFGAQPGVDVQSPPGGAGL